MIDFILSVLQQIIICEPILFLFCSIIFFGLCCCIVKIIKF